MSPLFGGSAARQRGCAGRGRVRDDVRRPSSAEPQRAAATDEGRGSRRRQTVSIVEGGRWGAAAPKGGSDGQRRWAANPRGAKIPPTGKLGPATTQSLAS